MTGATAADVTDLARAALGTVADPCSVAAGAPASLVDLGLVGALSVAPGAEGTWDIAVTLRLTEPTCWMGFAFTTSAREALAAVPGAGRVTVDLDTAMSWTPDAMSSAYAARLRAARARKAALLGMPRPPASTGPTDG